MNANLVSVLVVIVFLQNECNTSPVYSEDFSFNAIDDRPFAPSKAYHKSIDNSVKSVRNDIKRKTCGQILIETLPMICQHSSDRIASENDFEYSGNHHMITDHTLISHYFACFGFPISDMTRIKDKKN